MLNRKVLDFLQFPRSDKAALQKFKHFGPSYLNSGFEQIIANARM